MFGVSIVGPHTAQVCCLQANCGTFTAEYQQTTTDHNRLSFGLSKAYFFLLLILSGHLVIPQNMGVLVTPSIGEKKSSSCYSCAVNKGWTPFRRVIELTRQPVCLSGRFCFFFWIHVRRRNDWIDCEMSWIFLLFTLVLLIVHSWFLIRCFV